jgi:non-ribosomal peptide synthetase component F
VKKAEAMVSLTRLDWSRSRIDVYRSEWNVVAICRSVMFDTEGRHGKRC